jgi:hypothetical protein
MDGTGMAASAGSISDVATQFATDTDDHRRILRQIGTDVWPLLGQAIERRAEKRYDSVGHFGVLGGELALNKCELPTQPCLVLLGCAVDAHVLS